MDVDEDVEDGWDTVIGEAIQNESILPEEIRAKPPRGSAAQQSGLIFKKYHCKECPYGECFESFIQSVISSSDIFDVNNQ